MLCALIMAGGKGERFWPLSTEEKPKQFLNLLGEETMIQMTIKRLEGLIPFERIFVVTAKRYVNLVKEQLPKLPETNIIVEPVGKNTAPCIALSAFVIEKYYKDASIAVLPSDHLIQDEERFRETLRSAYKFSNLKENSVITLGMKPDRPETGYGYIKFGKDNYTLDNTYFKNVDKFVEKPNVETAIKYLNEGNYLWNGGMFVWKAETILKLTKQYLSNTYQVLSEIATTSDENFEKVLEEKYGLVDSISVDYGIMERADNIYVIPSDFGWDDIGTWKSLERYRKRDSNNNVAKGYVQNINSHNNIVIGKNKPIVIIGLDNILLVESEDVILVADKKEIDNIKNIKQMIK